MTTDLISHLSHFKECTEFLYAMASSESERLTQRIQDWRSFWQQDFFLISITQFLLTLKPTLDPVLCKFFIFKKKMEAFRQPLIRKVLIVSRICQLTCLAKKNIYFGNNLIIYNKDNYIVVRMHLIIKSLLLETSSKCHLSLNSILSLTLQNTLIFKLLSLQSRPLISY